VDVASPLSQKRFSDVQRARFGVSTAFFLLGGGAGFWAVYVPIVQARLAIDPGVLGLGLLTLALGAVAGMPLSGRTLARLGSQRPTVFLTLAYPFTVAAPLLSTSTSFLFTSLFVFGFAMGSLDVAINTQASEVEAARGVPTMSSFHAFFSLGGLAGAGAAAGAIAIGWGNTTGGIAAAFCLLAIGLAAAPNLWPARHPSRRGPTFVLPNRAAIGLGALAFLSFAVEGAVTDWSALYLTSVKLSGPVLAAAGFAAFSVAMTGLRLTGDAVVARLGPMRTVFFGGVLVVIGIAMAVAAPWPVVAAIGFGLVGAGAANVVPVALSAGSRLPDMVGSQGVAAVLTFGYVGYLLSPPLLGFAARTAGLTASLILVGLMGAAIAAIAAVARRASP
jgi:predicted MFS family arabinose efflux permease